MRSIGFPAFLVAPTEFQWSQAVRFRDFAQRMQQYCIDPCESSGAGADADGQFESATEG
jgi:hypothetical protein